MITKIIIKEVQLSIIFTNLDLDNFDWVYIFDADEFILLKNKSMVKKELSLLPKNIDTLRYQIDNWIVPEDFDAQNISDFYNITAKSAPNISPNSITDDVKYKRLISGDLNFFNLEFPSKIIFRPTYLKYISSGAHNVITTKKINEKLLCNKLLNVCHLPITSLDRVLMRCQQGENLIRLNYPFWHGWQNQALRFLQRKKKLI